MLIKLLFVKAERTAIIYKYNPKKSVFRLFRALTAVGHAAVMINGWYQQ